jgi:hypothetical protein
MGEWALASLSSVARAIRTRTSFDSWSRNLYGRTPSSTMSQRRSGPSATETAEARAEVDTIVTHPDGSMVQGIFQYGLREF